MSSLYEIDNSILDCIDAETGEIIDAEKLDSLMMEREQKIESVACWVKNLLCDADAYKTEKQIFDEREKAARKKAEGLKIWLSNALGSQKFSTVKASITFRKSEAVQIENETKIPKEYIREKIETAPDKTAIKEALKSGKTVDGCSLVINQNIQIK